MSPKRSIGVVVLVLLATGVLPISGATPKERASGSLPSVTQGPRPGPEILYAPPAGSPLLENGPRWEADPLMVSGAAAYRAGEFVYQDYLYEGFGANTTDEPMASPETAPPTPVFGGMTGDVVYPADGERYGYNAADLVELRIDADGGSIAYRFTLNTLLVPDSTAVAVGIDTDGGEEETDWGHGLGSLGPLDLEHVLYTDGASASLDDTPVQVQTDTTRNQIEVVVPRDVLDPGIETWTHYALTGIADGAGGFVPLADEPSETEPGGAHGGDVPRPSTSPSATRLTATSRSTGASTRRRWGRARSERATGATMGRRWRWPPATSRRSRRRWTSGRWPRRPNRPTCRRPVI